MTIFETGNRAGSWCAVRCALPCIGRIARPCSNDCPRINCACLLSGGHRGGDHDADSWADLKPARAATFPALSRRSPKAPVGAPGSLWDRSARDLPFGNGMDTPLGWWPGYFADGPPRLAAYPSHPAASGPPPAGCVIALQKRLRRLDVCGSIDLVLCGAQDMLDERANVVVVIDEQNPSHGLKPSGKATRRQCARSGGPKLAPWI